MIAAICFTAVGIVFVAGAWDVLTKYVEMAKFNREALDELRQLREANTRLEATVRTMGERMQAVSLNARRPTIGQVR